MSTPTATMPAPKNTKTEIMINTISRQNELGTQMMEALERMEEIEHTVIKVSKETNNRLDDIENTITLRDSECTELQRAVMLKASELTKEFLDGQSVSQNYHSSKKGQFIRLVYKRIKTRFNVHKYTLVTHVEFDKAYRFVNDIKLNDFSDIETRETPKQIELRKLEDVI